MNVWKKLPFRTITNTRDKKLLILLLFIVIVFAFYTFIMGPFLNKGAILGEEAKLLERQLEHAQNIATNLPMIKGEEKELRKSLVEKYEIFFDDLKSERMLHWFDSIMASTGLQASFYSPGDVTVSPIGVENATHEPLTYPLYELASKANQAVADGDTASKGDAFIGSTDQGTSDAVLNGEIGFQFNNTGYSNIIAFLKTVESMNKTIIPKSINIYKSEEGAGLSGEITLGLYAMEKVGGKEESYLQFTPITPTEKVDPFTQ
ncbi:MAG: hypothetical protein ACOX5F_03915 [Anaerovoracaceae bacterium]|jgi:hypothetical protein